MSKLIKLLCAGVLATVALADAASAQYYPPPYPPPGYYPPPPPPPRRVGNRCDAYFRTPYGPQQLICELYEPKPLGWECHCPAPPPPPGYPPQRDPRGRVIR